HLPSAPWTDGAVLRSRSGGRPVPGAPTGSHDHDGDRPTRSPCQTVVGEPCLVVRGVRGARSARAVRCTPLVRRRVPVPTVPVDRQATTARAPLLIPTSRETARR